MEVLFLDIDGCLNNADPCVDLYYDKYDGKDLALDECNLENLRRILDARPDLKIVWSTSWRYVDEEKWQNWLNPRVYLEKLDWMKDRVIGKTPMKMSSEHFHDIKWWLDDHPEVERYAIIEDSYFPEKWFGLEKHLVQCDPTFGLTPSDVGKALSILDR